MGNVAAIANAIARVRHDLATLEALEQCIKAGVAVGAALEAVAAATATGIQPRIDGARRHLDTARTNERRARKTLDETIALEVIERL